MRASCLLLSLLTALQTSAAQLNPDQRRALAQAQDSFWIRVLRHPDGDTVVLLGETHFKLRRAHDAGRALLPHFPARGLEAEDGAAMSEGMRSQEKVTGQIYRVLNKVTGDRGPYGSTLTDALDVPPAPGAGELHIVQLEKLAEGETLHPSTLMFYLELTAGQLALPLMFVKYRGLYRWPMRYLAIAVPALVASGAIGHYSARPYDQATSVERKVLHVYYGALERRNDLMVRNIVGSKSQRGPTPLLAMVGAAHLKGMTQILTQKYGYLEVEAPTLDPETAIQLSAAALARP